LNKKRSLKGIIDEFPSNYKRNPKVQPATGGSCPVKRQCRNQTGAGKNPLKFELIPFFIYIPSPRSNGGGSSSGIKFHDEIISSAYFFVICHEPIEIAPAALYNIS
jgi:hypothetical protein